MVTTTMQEGIVKQHIPWDIPKELQEPLLLLSAKTKRIISIIDWTQDNVFEYIKANKDDWFLIVPNHIKVDSAYQSPELPVSLNEQTLKFMNARWQYKQYSDDKTNPVLQEELLHPLADKNNVIFGQASQHIIQLFFNPFDNRFSIFDCKMFINMLVKYLLSMYIDLSAVSIDKKAKGIAEKYRVYVTDGLMRMRDAIQDKIYNDQADIQNHYRALQRLERSIRDNITLSRSLSRRTSLMSDNLDSTRLYEMFKTLLGSKKFVDFSFDGPRIYAYTGEIIIKYRNKIFPVGQFKIMISVDGTVKMSNLTKKYEEYDHPHVSAEIPCLGNIKELVPKLIYDGDYLGLLNVLYDFLISYNPDGPYVQLERGWGKDEDWCGDCDHPVEACRCSRCNACGSNTDDCECERCPSNGRLMEETDCSGCDHFRADNDDEDPYCRY